MRVSPQTKFASDESKMEGIFREIMDMRAGIFKLESSEQLTPLEVLEKYRTRTMVEHMIDSLKRVTGLNLRRVWSESSIRGSMILAPLSEVTMTIARYEMKGRTKAVEKEEERRS